MHKIAEIKWTPILLLYLKSARNRYNTVQQLIFSDIIKIAKAFVYTTEVYQSFSFSLYEYKPN